jgi:hypothetical protein
MNELNKFNLLIDNFDIELKEYKIEEKILIIEILFLLLNQTEFTEFLFKEENNIA